MKLGAYGGLRVAMNLLPQGFQMWSKWIAILAVIGIVYAAAVALRQSDLKFVIGYSSVSHMGFVLLGLATANVLGVSGAVLQMFSHGVIGALLFAIAGRMIYPRTHTRDLDQLSRMNLSRAHAVCRVRLRYRVRCVDGHSRLQWIRRGNHDPHRHMENFPDAQFGSPVSAWCSLPRLHCARCEKVSSATITVLSERSRGRLRWILI